MKIYTFNDKVLTRNTKWLKEYEEPTPPTPSLPPYTIRMKFTDGVTPTFSKGTRSQVTSSPNVWDLTYENADWSNLCDSQNDLLEVIDANTTGVTNMSAMFNSCSSLYSVSLFDTSSATDMSWMFGYCGALTSVPLYNTSSAISMERMFNACYSLTSIPLFNTTNITYMTYMFNGCTNVQSGALALYQQASTQATPPANHSGAFNVCGRDTVTGAAELAQIPTSWGGTAS